MNTILHKKKGLFFCLFILLSYGLSGQKLIESRENSYYTYIYKITDKEAEDIYQKDISHLHSSNFHSLIDSFPTDSAYSRILPRGHYIKTFAEGNQQKVAITTVADFEVFVFNNNTDLCIQVYDLQGNLIQNAEVSVRLKKLRFNRKTQSYLDKKSNQKGMLKIRNDGFTAYFNLSREYNNPLVKRSAQKLVYGRPLRYVWTPVNYLVRLPVDGAKSIFSKEPRGTIESTGRFFKKTYQKIACWFNDYHCDYNSYAAFKVKHTGYLVFNKPKYAPGDTVKFKAFVLTKNGRPLTKKTRVVLSAGKDILLTQLDPYRKGGYEYEFYLHDSLQLKLDRKYSIRLELNDSKPYIENSFTYEEYELAKNTLSLRTVKAEHYYTNPFSFFVKGTDENDLNLLDARLEICLKSKTVNRYFEDSTFIPDTLLVFQKKLDPSFETEIVIPDSTFPKANFNYIVEVRMLNSENESTTKTQEISYFYKREEFEITSKTDSLHFEYLHNGRSTPKEVKIHTTDNYGNNTPVFSGKTPCQIPLLPYYASYTIQADSLSETMYVSKEPSLLECFSKRTNDSIYLTVNNPRKIPFLYNVYKRNTSQSYGYSDSLKIKAQTDTRQNYFISIRYLWGGEVKEKNYSIPLLDKKMTISVKEPKVVYPGQKTRIEIAVKDSEGNAVEGVDLTAFSVTKKFDYAVPKLPYLEKRVKSKNIINRHHITEYTQNSYRGLHLDYDTWKILAALDTIEYYQFLYPEKGIYRTEFPAKDSITQFAPFVVSKGGVIPIHVIYVDNKPIYFSWSTSSQPYSFRIDTGYHQIKLRTTSREIVLSNIRFEKGEKLVFSIDQDTKVSDVTIREAENKLSENEKTLLYKYIFPYEYNFGEQPAYIEVGNSIHVLNTENSLYTSEHLAGPLVGNMKFQLMDSFSIPFKHEPFYRYTFSPGLLKMKSVDPKGFPEHLYSSNVAANFQDAVISKEALKSKWEQSVNLKRFSTHLYQSSSKTQKGAGRLGFQMKEQATLNDIPLNVLVFRYDNHTFLKVYPGNVTLLHDLQEGYYRLLFFYTGAKYHIVDSIYVRPNGLNYYEFEQPDSLQKDTFSVEVSSMIERAIIRPSLKTYEEEAQRERIQSMYQQQFRYKGNGNVIEGYLYDDQGKEPLIGATVVVKGTNYGTVTDLDGYYSILAPPGYNTLIFSYIGYETHEIEADQNTMVNVNLLPSVSRLEEVVVIGYGSMKKQTVVSSMALGNKNQSWGETSGFENSMLSGKLAGVVLSIETRKEGTDFDLKIRGASSVFEFAKTPLIIINGLVFTGDISTLDPAIIERIEVLKDADATSLYGEKGANGVVIIKTLPGLLKPNTSSSNEANIEQSFFDLARQATSIRNNFSDYAFWQPTLRTDKDGKASFDVVFPEDVTSWETFYLAMNDKSQYGQLEGLIKSHKPLMAQLAIPRFLVQQDSFSAIGKVLNYAPDSIEVVSTFEVDEKEWGKKSRYCSNALVDTLLMVAISDSLHIQYSLETKDGYYDGEKRSIPVYPTGMETTKGNFYMLQNDTTFYLRVDSSLGPVKLYARKDVLDLVEEEVHHVRNYTYSCNEQLASKLKVLLAERSITLLRGDKFKHDREVEKLIRVLLNNQNDKGLWGWWNQSKESLWISLHVLEALTHAAQVGYSLRLNEVLISESLFWILENSVDFDERSLLLKMATLLRTKINYQYYITDLEKDSTNTLNELLRIIELKQLCKMQYKTDTLKSFKKTTLFGNVFYSDSKPVTSIVNNDLQNTLLVYKILRSDSTTSKESLHHIQNYFLEKRQNGYWENTFESAQVIEAILPDLLSAKPKMPPANLTFKGDLDTTIYSFPFEVQINPKQGIEISKSGDAPIYFTTHQTYWNNTPSINSGNFEIETAFEGVSSNMLANGKEHKLIAKVKVKKDASYVMINIPIPAGCSYANKKNDFLHESHREYFNKETTIFCDRLPAGEYLFTVDLISKYAGIYTMNPAKIELMYFSTFFANNERKTIKIE